MGLGDALMASGAARIAQQTDPRKIRVMHQRKPAWSEVWENNPRIAQLEERGDLQMLYARSLTTNMRPYHLDKTDKQWKYNPTFRADVGEIYLTPKECAFGPEFKPDIIIEPNIKAGASPNKAWRDDYWNAFVKMAIAAGYRLAQMGPPGARRFTGVDFFGTPTFRAGCSIVKRSLGIVTTEGGLHHAAAALGIPGVVIFGGFTPVELTGYAVHRNLGRGVDDACGMRSPCEHCKKAMAEITPEQVLEELKKAVPR